MIRVIEWLNPNSGTPKTPLDLYGQQNFYVSLAPGVTKIIFFANTKPELLYVIQVSIWNDVQIK